MIIVTLFFELATFTDRCLSSTAGQMAVGEMIMAANSPSVHSAFTEGAHRLWIWEINAGNIGHQQRFNSPATTIPTHRHVTPAAGEAADAVIGFYSFPAL